MPPATLRIIESLADVPARAWNALVGDEIPLMARVLSVFNSFDAMTSDRPYRAALPLAVAVRRLRDGADARRDPEIVSVFVETVDCAGHTADLATVGDDRR